ncbi:MAG: tetratricopeptide repeat protein [Verrucomicrobia bacterium]|jgi:tetratricopeptide (TPR) repeat protein|nr:tetratricopeptide repeat protein [Verrucomicrobiota bacterium]OQC25742.1 MAG: hypothetical protein BWX68_01299 [Verrucomicrobia bacterium ADurb.Bin063]HOX63869.1 tetratricopeptide repeat protein [Verrucomicrobiota bacterium]HPW91790.1 tetratricopeptide repeat protein [Verrucomicrobiota bacterium]HQB72503.1 tetratricopeptide repeat protein [Verrucomicrobiota bacterium]
MNVLRPIFSGTWAAALTLALVGCAAPQNATVPVFYAKPGNFQAGSAASGVQAKASLEIDKTLKGKQLLVITRPRATYDFNGIRFEVPEGRLRFAIGDLTENGVKEAARERGVALLPNRQADRSPHITVRVCGVKLSVSFREPPMEVHASVILGVILEDDRGTSLGVETYSGQAICKHSRLRNLVGGLIDLGTLNAARKADMHLIYEAALKAAIANAAAQVSRDAANPQWLERKLTTESGNDAVVAARRGVDFFQQDRYWRAYWYFKTSVGMDSSNQAARTYYAACLARLGQYTQAKTEFQRAIGIDPNSEDANQARKWVAQLNR